MTALAPALQAFFTDRLARQRQASPHTIAAYRDTWRLLLGYASQHTGRQPSQLDLADLDAPLIGNFPGHLEHHRGNTARTRNARLAAIHSLFRYAALRHPEHAEMIARVLAIPPKRYDKALVTWLTEPELAALLAAPDRSAWAGRRDHALILLAAQTGLRISELTGLTVWVQRLGSGERDLGEASVLAAAQRRGGTAVVDDREAVKVARAHHAEVHGTLWLLAGACREGKLTEPAAGSLIDALRATGLRLPCTGAEFPNYAQQHGLL